MTEPSIIEKIASNLLVQGAATTVGILGANITPLAAFVPFLVDSLASGRQSKRLEAMLGELQLLTEQNAEKLKDMTDDQYKVVNEAISAAFYTIDLEKIELLKRAASNAFMNPDAVEELSDSLSRIIRDISAAEVAFIAMIFGYENIVVREDAEGMENTLAIKPHSTEEILLSGLINLGLLYSKTTRWDTVSFEWSPLVSKLIRLLDVA